MYFEFNFLFFFFFLRLFCFVHNTLMFLHNEFFDGLHFVFFFLFMVFFVFVKQQWKEFSNNKNAINSGMSLIGNNEKFNKQINLFTKLNIFVGHVTWNDYPCTKHCTFFFIIFWISYKFIAEIQSDSDSDCHFMCSSFT